MFASIKDVFDPPTLIEGPTTVPNILKFGETGARKTSLINLIAGTPHSFTIPGTTQAVQVWDTPGLNDGEHGTIPALQAMKNLEHLVSKMRQGVSLLVYCVRGPRFRDGWKTNYNLIVKGFCQGKVPVVLIVTGLENESPSMENWWTRNEKVFEENEMEFSGHACITSRRGKQSGSGEYVLQVQFEKSEQEARELIVNHCGHTPWIMDRESWPSRTRIIRMVRYFGARRAALLIPALLLLPISDAPGKLWVLLHRAGHA
ncbi:hypothetical protein FPV67DRAFT_1703196 [Lyophyllum atratum]|nr:hypothetical protein FPV67DRAFT_1703196 [Lyophyllum atratum]